MTRILLIEDDDISRIYLSEALKGPDSSVTACEGFTQAVAVCRADTFDLIVSDIQLQDGSLLERASCLPAGIPILATSAELNAELRNRLETMGIEDFLAKPAAVGEIRAAVNRILRPGIEAGSPLWDESHALKTLGHNADALRRLKALFKSELPAMAEEIQQALDAGQTAQVHAIVHKLKASCGFLGATRLLHACHALDSDPGKAAHARFVQSLNETLATL